MNANKEHRWNDNWYGKPETIKENPIPEPLEQRSAVQVK